MRLKKGDNMEYLKKYNSWLDNDYFDESTRTELANLKDNEEEIKERFYKDLDFGTAGLRGVLGAGSNRMNLIQFARQPRG